MVFKERYRDNLLVFKCMPYAFVYLYAEVQTLLMKITKNISLSAAQTVRNRF